MEKMKIDVSRARDQALTEATAKLATAKLHRQQRLTVVRVTVCQCVVCCALCCCHHHRGSPVHLRPSPPALRAGLVCTWCSRVWSWYSWLFVSCPPTTSTYVRASCCFQAQAQLDATVTLQNAEIAKAKSLAEVVRVEGNQTAASVIATVRCAPNVLCCGCCAVAALCLPEHTCSAPTPRCPGVVLLLALLALLALACLTWLD